MSDANPYRVPPTPGPATTSEKLAARVDQAAVDFGYRAVWAWRTAVLCSFIALTIGVRTCSVRWSEEQESRWAEACLLSNDAPYQGRGGSCLCLAPNGSRYNPSAAREGCGGD